MPMCRHESAASSPSSDARRNGVASLSVDRTHLDPVHASDPAGDEHATEQGSDPTIDPADKQTDLVP